MRIDDVKAIPTQLFHEYKPMIYNTFIYLSDICYSISIINKMSHYTCIGKTERYNKWKRKKGKLVIFYFMII